MPTEGPSTRQKERKDPDQTSGNLVLEIRALTATIDALKLSFEQQLDSKVDSLRDSVQLMMDSHGDTSADDNVQEGADEEASQPHSPNPHDTEERLLRTPPPPITLYHKNPPIPTSLQHKNPPIPWT
uniref:Uncharacterized protein n=1 Tax=Knipowitschia caucasica TaxID=637954 RepID=A0AAV2KDD1_KNICA